MSAERLDVGPDARILDLCCGTGVSTKALGETHPGAAITGLDFSEGMLANARKKGLPATFVHGNAQDLRAAGIVGEFDGVFMSWGIRNIPDPDRALDELFAVLKRVLSQQWVVLLLTQEKLLRTTRCLLCQMT